MGEDHGQGRGMQHDASPPEPMVGDSSQHRHEGDAQDIGQDQQEVTDHGEGARAQHSGDDGRDGFHDQVSQGGCGQHQRGTPSQSTSILHGVRECGQLRDDVGSPLSAECESGIIGCPEVSVAKPLPESTSRKLSSCVDDMLPNALSGLASSGRLELLEIACSGTSVLTSETRRLTGRESAAERRSLWNGCDLSTNAGIRKAVQTIDLKRPKNVWMSPICGPYSMMQNANQRTPEQVEDLQEKRRDALKQYVGCCVIYSYAVRAGCHVTWEWSQTCQGWRLPLIQALQKKHDPWFAVVRGCQVNLRDKNQQFISKGWKIMTTHEALAKAMDLPCRCPRSYKHVSCEGSITSKTAFYTPEFARRVCRTMLRGYTTEQIKWGLRGNPLQHESFGSGQTCECEIGSRHEASLTCGLCQRQEWCHMLPQSMVSGEENPQVEQPDAVVPGHVHELGSEEIRRRLYLLHASTGHGPLRHLVRMLEQQNASPKVLEEAKKFQCTVCHEKSRPKPRPFASF